MRRQGLRRRGFTLIELIVVIAAIAVLAALLVPAVAGVIDDGRVSRCSGELRNIKDAANRYLAHCGAYPPLVSMAAGTWGTDPGLVNKTLVDPTHTTAWKGPYLEKWPVVTPWGGPPSGGTCGAQGAYHWEGVKNVIDMDGKGAGAAGNDHWIRMDPACMYYPTQSIAKVDEALDDGAGTTGVVRTDASSVLTFLAGEGPQGP